jgi:hypothetical protein
VEIYGFSFVLVSTQNGYEFSGLVFRVIRLRFWLEVCGCSVLMILGFWFELKT